MVVRKKNGFGIIEVLISGTIIATVLAALVGVGNVALRSSKSSLQRTQAIYLAQDWIESVRMSRDTAWTDADPVSKWDSLCNTTNTMTGLLSPRRIIKGYLIGGCFMINSNEEGPSNPSDPSSNSIPYYTDVILDGTTFRRRMEIGLVDKLIPGTDMAKDDNAMRVKVIVSWDNPAKKIEVSELLTNWRPNF